MISAINPVNQKLNFGDKTIIFKKGTQEATKILQKYGTLNNPTDFDKRPTSMILSSFNDLGLPYKDYGIFIIEGRPEADKLAARMFASMQKDGDCVQINSAIKGLDIFSPEHLLSLIENFKKLGMLN